MRPGGIPGIGGGWTATPTMSAAYERVDRLLDDRNALVDERDRARATAVELEGQLAEAVDLLRWMRGESERDDHWTAWSARVDALLTTVAEP